MTRQLHQITLTGKGILWPNKTSPWLSSITTALVLQIIKRYTSVVLNRWPPGHIRPTGLLFVAPKLLILHYVLCTVALKCKAQRQIRKHNDKTESITANLKTQQQIWKHNQKSENTTTNQKTQPQIWKHNHNPCPASKYSLKASDLL